MSSPLLARCDLLAVDFFAGLVRAGAIYAPVHTVPVLLFKLRALQLQPGRTAASVSRAIARSALFLSGYQVIVKLTMCMLRISLRYLLCVQPKQAHCSLHNNDIGFCYLLHSTHDQTTGGSLGDAYINALLDEGDGT